MTNILISTSYFPPISYFKAILSADSVTLEQHENFIKKTYRNRCRIYAANGTINLTVPVQEAVRRKVLVRDVKIDYSTDWQKQHFKSIESAYNSSPFFEYLVDDFTRFFNQRTTFLFDLNQQILQQAFETMEIAPQIDLSTNYEGIVSNKKDLRNSLQAKNQHENQFVNKKAYTQVFGDKQGFQEDLSILDLLFNLGSQAYSYLVDKF